MTFTYSLCSDDTYDWKWVVVLFVWVISLDLCSVNSNLRITPNLKLCQSQFLCEYPVLFLWWPNTIRHNSIAMAVEIVVTFTLLSINTHEWVPIRNLPPTMANLSQHGGKFVIKIIFWKIATEIYPAYLYRSQYQNLRPRICFTSWVQMASEFFILFKSHQFNWNELAPDTTRLQKTWWRHQMETFSALLAICEENSPVPGEFPTQRPVTRSFDVFFDLHPNNRLSKQWWGWWFETLSHPLWRHRNDGSMKWEVYMYQDPSQSTAWRKVYTLFDDIISV